MSPLDRWQAAYELSKRLELDSSSAAVLVALSRYAQNGHTAWPKVSTLAEDTRLDRKTVMVAIDRLEASGAITVERRHAKPSVCRILWSAEIGTQNGDPKTVLKQNRLSTKSGTQGVPKTVLKVSQKRDTEHGKNKELNGVSRTPCLPQNGKPIESEPPDTGQAAHVVAIYNETAKDVLPMARPRPQSKTVANIKARLRENPGADWGRIFAAVCQSPWHRGENRRNWRADLAWIVLPTNFDKCLAIAARAELEANEPSPRRTRERRVRQGGFGRVT